MKTKIEKLAIRYEPLFWAVFILLPIFTGWFHYSYLPNEYYDERHHELLESHPEAVGPEGLQSTEAPDMWKDVDTGEVFSAENFSKHRTQEAWRIAFISFAYGLIGCFFFAFTRVEKKKASFSHSLGVAALVNLVIATLFFMAT